MSRRFDLSFGSEPFWLQEAFGCMNYVHMLDSEEWLNKSDGCSRQRKEEFLLPYRSYRGAMRVRLQPVFAQYPLLAGYVDPKPRNLENVKSSEPPIMSFLIEMQDVLEAQEMLSEEKLEAELNLAFQRMLESSLQKLRDIREGQDSSDCSNSLDAEELVIRGLPDVLSVLEGWEGTDADKLKLLRLYSERREVLEQLWSIKEACRKIGWECLESVQDCYEAGVEEIKKPEAVENLLEKIGLQCEGIYSGQITLGIMPFGRIIIQMRAVKETPGHSKMKLHIGIAAFRLFDFREEDYFQDERLLLKLKALSDATRLKILHQLAERPGYLQELAKALGLTPATVLHHLGILLAEGLIEILATTGKKKIYYQIKKQGLEEVSKGILQLSLSRQEKDSQIKQQMWKGQQYSGGMQIIQTEKY